MFKLFSRKTQQNTKNSPAIETSIFLNDIENIDAIACYFKKITGVNFDRQKIILKSKLTTFCKKNTIVSFDQCLSEIKQSHQLEQQLINELTTNESYFYREHQQLLDLVNRIKLQDKKTRILCAPCSTGEEIYSIIMLLLEENLTQDDFDILGIDINSDALKKAGQGIYNERSLSKLPEKLLNKYFKKSAEKYHIINEVKQCARLKKDNVFAASFKQNGKFDYILSRNLLIYFDQTTKITVKNTFQTMLTDTENKIYFGHADLF